VRIAIGFGGPASGRARDFEEQVRFAVEAERLGVDSAWSAEAWGMDGVAPLAFLAARTQRLRLGTGILQVSARTPSMTAMTALTLAAISGDRFLLGLGASGPQVVEGLHGVPFARPMLRLREHIEIVRKAFRGEPLVYQGRHHVLPLPGGQGKALRLSQPANPKIPIYLAVLSPAGLALCGELADGWLGTSFTPEHAEAHFAHLAAGAARAGRRLADLDLCVGAAVGFAADPEPLIRARKPGLAFTLGAMGSAKTNFYNEAYRRGGWDDAAREVQALWLAGRRDEAAARVPDELVLQTSMLGSEAAVRARIRRYRDAGITTLRVEPLGENAHARLETLGRTLELVRAECGSTGA
jgi:F420-dependent oxidoreductase-like protein